MTSLFVPRQLFNRLIRNFESMNFIGGTISSSTNAGDHLTRTLGNTREADVHDVRVSEVLTLSPTVKEFVLKTEERPTPFTFKAGQWVDVIIPGVSTVGGFSMSSSPQELATGGTLRLAIKYSTHPPAHWMHKSCMKGSTLKIRVGGDFYLNLDELKPNSKILLIAGGVGINPISSIIQCLHEEIGNTNISQTRVFLLFSAKNKDELLFQNIFTDYQTKNPNFIANYFVTDSLAKPHVGTLENCRRIQKSDLEKAAKWLT